MDELLLVNDDDWWRTSGDGVYGFDGDGHINEAVLCRGGGGGYGDGGMFSPKRETRTFTFVHLCVFLTITTEVLS